MTFQSKAKSAVYIGETENLRRRAYHYRNPGPHQKTSLRINSLLREELTGRTRVTLATVANPRIEIDGKVIKAEFSRKPHRLLFENAALVGAAGRGNSGDS